MKMKFGTLYSYWGTKWQCDYLKTLKRVSDIGFDILEMGAPHLLEMSDYELSELRRAAKDMDMVLTANIGPAKDKDLASPDPDIRKAGVNYLIDAALYSFTSFNKVRIMNSLLSFFLN